MELTFGFWQRENKNLVGGGGGGGEKSTGWGIFLGGGRWEGGMRRFSAGGLKNFLTDYHLSHISQTSIYNKKMIAVIITLR